MIGFIGGVDNPLINHFAAGYQAGAQYIDPDMQVLIDYAGSFNDPTTAKTIANTFVEKRRRDLPCFRRIRNGYVPGSRRKRLCSHRRKLKPE